MFLYAQEHAAKIHGLQDKVKTDALLQRAEAPMWLDGPLPDDRCGIDKVSSAFPLAPNLGTLPSPPSHLDLHIDRQGSDQGTF